MLLRSRVLPPVSKKPAERRRDAEPEISWFAAAPGVTICKARPNGRGETTIRDPAELQSCRRLGKLKPAADEYPTLEIAFADRSRWLEISTSREHARSRNDPERYEGT